MRKLTLITVTLLAAAGVHATTLSDNLAGSTFGTELISGSTWVAAGFNTGSSSYLLNSATFLMQQDSAGTLNVTLYSNAAMQPSNGLGFQPGMPLGSLSAPASFPNLLAPVTFGGNNLKLAQNTMYWLVMSAASNGSYEWAYEAGNSGSGVGFYPSWGYSNDSGTSWFSSNSQPMQMSVTGTPMTAVPEPSAGWLVLLGLVAIMSAALRRARSRTR